MEKQRAKHKIKFIYGLLIFFAFHAYSQSSLDIRGLRILPQDAPIRTNSECMFTLQIPLVKPVGVQIESPGTLQDASFISLQRGQLPSGTGTEIKLYYTFKKAGTYTLPPLHVRINNRSYAIPFLEINVEHDLENLQPRLIMKFDNGIEVSSTEKYSAPIFTVTAGEKMYFTLYLQYAIQINQFSWNAPKDAILTELQRYEMLDASSRKEGVSQEKIPVARFEWLVLKNGTVSLPDIQISVIAYNGERSRISPLQCEVVVKEKSHESISKNESQKYFVYAFEKPFDENENEKKIVITKKDCQTLATLRSNEKHSFLPYKAKLERKEFEKSLNLANAENELNIPFVIFIFSLAVVGIIFALVFFMLKRRGVSFLSFCCSLCIFVVLVIAKANPFLYGGIASGGELFAVPDKTSHVISVLPVGMRVSIEEKAANWFYVKYGSMGGWVELNHIIIIR